MCQWVQSFSHGGHGGVQWHIFSSSAFPCQTPFCQTAPLLPSVMQQQNTMEYWWEGSTTTAIPSTSASSVVGQHNKIGGITSGAALLYLKMMLKMFVLLLLNFFLFLQKTAKFALANSENWKNVTQTDSGNNSLHL